MSGHDPNNDSMIFQSISDKSRALFDQACDQMDVATANRLRLMRRDAQHAAPPSRPLSFFRVGVVFVGVFVLGLVWWVPHNQPAVSTATAIETTNDAALVLDEDPDVYAWLADAPVATDSDKVGSL